MADDRIYLQCNICGDKFFLGKQFAWDAFYLEDYHYELHHDKTFIERLNEFYEAHNHIGEDVCRYNGNYSIVYESDDWGDWEDIAIPCQFKITKDCDGCKGLAICEKNNTKHGHWIDDWDIGCSVCSECDDSFLWEDFNGVREFNYCPTCGAKMDEVT